VGGLDERDQPDCPGDRLSQDDRSLPDAIGEPSRERCAEGVRDGEGSSGRAAEGVPAGLRADEDERPELAHRQRDASEEGHHDVGRPDGAEQGAI
jgi:hypothetical protein